MSKIAWRVRVKREVNDAEQAFRSCWGLLAALKEGKRLSDGALSLPEFQPRLAEALYGLSKSYHEIEQEKSTLVMRKRMLASAWFNARMRFLSKQQEILLHAVQVGKVIGDGFAWYFYREDRQFLAEHLAEPPQWLMSTGTGGAAEISFIRSTVCIGGRFVLYHGITSMLRLGDITLVDLKTMRAVSLAELKAGVPRDGKINISVYSPLPIGIRSGPDNQPETREVAADEPKLSPKALDRLRRQMKRITSSHAKREERPDQKKSLDLLENRAEHLGQLVETVPPLRSSWRRFGKGTAYMVLCHRRASLYRRLSSKDIGGLKRQMDSVTDVAQQIMLPGRSDNALILVSWMFGEGGPTALQAGMTHPVWWPMSARALERVIFQEAVVMALYNPAHLVSAIEDAGYTVAGLSPDQFNVSKRVGDTRVELEGMSFYIRMVHTYLFDEEDVVNVLEAANSAYVGREGRGKVAMWIEQRFGRRPNDSR
ncbi:hypothetical protein [Methylibium petroleiphilum]|uniref:hypothetical protein n=1 Tax=Methylibium petroleiphilum TaxID=105560 RepID=UPI001AC60D85|nr:hypothetical protein [Methylibium petroleiphilum]MBN9205075.1 hypothetical protein [Methylibium petroleiphilum]